MTNKAVCYTTDVGYLFPSFVSASQARRRLSPGLGDVLIVAFDIDAKALDLFGPACEQAGVTLLPVSTEAVDGASPYYARFFLANLLPPHIDTFLYVDSDTQITRPLDPLLSYSIPAGRFLAVADPMTFLLPDSDKLSRDFMAHFHSIGLSPEQIATYFNSGVMMSSRGVWRDVGRESWDIARAQPRDTRFPDQDVLNFAAKGRNLPLALAWNFPIYMRNLQVADVIQPSIVHYMSSPKPWLGVFPPWTRAEYAVYDAAIQAHPELAPYRKRMPAARRLRYHLQQRYKRIVESIGVTSTKRRERILDYESGAILKSASDTSSDTHCKEIA